MNISDKKKKRAVHILSLDVMRVGVGKFDAAQHPSSARVNEKAGFVFFFLCFLQYLSESSYIYL